MASSSTTFVVVSLLAILTSGVNAHISLDLPLSINFYQKTCWPLEFIVISEMALAVSKEKRMGASILRLFFHDCFVNGCDASVLLDDIPGQFPGEKNAFANQNSLRGFEVIDKIKSRVEFFCPGIVSCADILALAARAGVMLLRGPSWTVQLGRKDAKTANQTDANTQLPPPFGSLSTLISMFAAKGFNATEMTALSGGHTIGLSRCVNYRSHIYGDTNIDPTFAGQLKNSCSAILSGDPTTDNNTAPFESTPNKFDNTYYKDLVAMKGLLHSDQELFNNGTQDSLVTLYSQNADAFSRDFAAAMAKMSNLSLLTGTSGEIRKNCRIVNPLNP